MYFFGITRVDSKVEVFACDEEEEAERWVRAIGAEIEESLSAVRNRYMSLRPSKQTVKNGAVQLGSDALTPMKKSREQQQPTGAGAGVAGVGAPGAGAGAPPHTFNKSLTFQVDR